MCPAEKRPWDRRDPLSQSGLSDKTPRHLPDSSPKFIIYRWPEKPNNAMPSRFPFPCKIPILTLVYSSANEILPIASCVT